MADETRKNNSGGNSASGTGSSRETGDQVGRQSSPRSGTSNPQGNLSEEDRMRGGERSAESQTRDDQGQFAGRDAQDGDEGESGQSGGSSGRSGGSGGSSGSGGNSGSGSGSGRGRSSGN